MIPMELGLNPGGQKDVVQGQLPGQPIFDLTMNGSKRHGKHHVSGLEDFQS